jgi:tellurite resistance protein TerC
MLFPMAEAWWLYGAFTLLVLGLLALDLGVFHRKAHAVSIGEAAFWSVVWVALALMFNAGLYAFARQSFANNERLLATPGFDPEAAASRAGLEFLTGYVVEKALAVDNIFVFVVVFSFFGIPSQYQHRVLFYGILGALVFRAVFIGMGSLLMQYHIVIHLFGALLILTGLKMLFVSEKPIDPAKNPLMRLLSRVTPMTPEFDGQRFFVHRDGRWLATPLFAALMFLEFSDIVFAVDSVPAIFAITREPFLVFTSNIFAILGLRSMYFLLAAVVDRFHLLKYGLALVLMFVGLKMLWLHDLYGGKFPIGLSLGIIVGLIAASVIASLVFPARERAEHGAGESNAHPPREPAERRGEPSFAATRSDRTGERMADRTVEPVGASA